MSRVGLGTWAIGGWMWGGTEERESMRTIQAAIDRGIHAVDVMRVPKHIIYTLSRHRFLRSASDGKGFVVDRSSRFVPDRRKACEDFLAKPTSTLSNRRGYRTVFNGTPRCSFSHTSAFRLSPKTFQPRMERLHPSAFEKA